jgi:hypothetical protein
LFIIPIKNPGIVEKNRSGVARLIGTTIASGFPLKAVNCIKVTAMPGERPAVVESPDYRFF